MLIFQMVNEFEFGNFKNSILSASFFLGSHCSVEYFAAGFPVLFPCMVAWPSSRADSMYGWTGSSVPRELYVRVISVTCGGLASNGISVSEFICEISELLPMLLKAWCYTFHRYLHAAPKTVSHSCDCNIIASVSGFVMCTGCTGYNALHCLRAAGASGSPYVHTGTTAYSVLYLEVNMLCAAHLRARFGGAKSRRERKVH